MSDYDEHLSTRRQFLNSSACLMLPSLAMAGRFKKSLKESVPVAISPTEDLMREHGVVERLMLVFDDIFATDDPKRFNFKLLEQSLRLFRLFVQEYHEKLEEDYLFPAFREKDRLVDLVAVLNEQHRVGRKLVNSSLTILDSRQITVESLIMDTRQNVFLLIRMYRPHIAHEDTVLFPQAHDVMTQERYASTGHQFERWEEQLFGRNGFENVVDQVAAMEKKLDIYDLSSFTPQMPKEDSSACNFGKRH